MEPCSHENVVDDEGDKVCRDCGTLMANIDFGAEWKNYGDNSNSRCRYVGSGSTKVSLEDIIRKTGLVIGSTHKKEIEESYKKIVDEKNLRGNTKKAIIAACTLFCLRRNGIDVDYNDIRKRFEIDKKQFLEGITCHNHTFAESRTLGTDKSKIIENAVDKANEIFQATISHEIVNDYYVNFTKMDREFKHCSPKIGACAIIYFFLSRTSKIVKNDYCRKMDITDSAINKLYKNIPGLIEKVQKKIAE